jgi:hypothetical protein
MPKTLATAATVAAAALICVAVSSGQDVRPTPGFGTGVVTVQGTVDIGNSPSVAATQSGQWDVRVTNAPAVVAAPPEFLKAGRRYRVTWPDERSEVVVVAQLGSNGWTRVESTSGAGRRWINLAGAQAVEEL